MVSVTTVLETSLDSLKRRLIKIIRYGSQDGKNALEIAPYGIDSNVPKGYKAIYTSSQRSGSNVIIGYIREDLKAEEGSLRLYSEGNDIYIRKNGNIELGGNSDFMVRYSALETAFNELKSKFNAHVHSSSGTPPTVPSIADISGAKCPTIKTS